MDLNNSHILGGVRLKSYLNVSDILQRKHFENIEVIAGKDGLNRMVKWVHIVEVTNIRNLLNGNELILSTGVAWRDNDNLFISLLKQLIEAQASGLCVEIGTYTSNIPSKVIEIANQFHFPIILFHKEVPFVEITQDIHTLLINQQYEIISNLENYSQLLNKKLLTIKHSNEILKFVHQYLQTYVMIIFTNHRRTVYPKVSSLEEEEMLNDIEKNVRSASTLEVSINLLGSQYANLVLYSRNRLLTEYDQLILDRTATALAQFFIRELYVAEKRRVEETVWIKGWLEGEQNAESVSDFLSFHLPLLKPKGAFVCLYKFVSIERYPNITYFKLRFRAILEQRGFSFFTIDGLVHHLTSFVFCVTIGISLSTPARARIFTVWGVGLDSFSRPPTSRIRVYRPRISPSPDESIKSTSESSSTITRGRVRKISLSIVSRMYLAL